MEQSAKLAQNPTCQLLGADRMCALLQVWPIANTIAFRYIPQDLRIIYQNVLGVAMVNAYPLSAILSVANCSTASGMELHRVERASLDPLQGTYVSLLTSGSLG
jgi:Mpv17 / PMP22 family